VSGDDISSMTVREVLLSDCTPPSKATPLAKVVRSYFEDEFDPHGDDHQDDGEEG